MIPFVVDANVINYFQKERISGNAGPALIALDSIFGCGFIALDDTDLCKQEWLDCAAGSYPLALQDWVSDKLIEQKIKLFAMKNYNIYKCLMKLGVPKPDHKWVRLALSSDSKNVVTEDIDLIYPSKKCAAANTKEAIKKKCAGPAKTGIKKNFGIEILCCQHVPERCQNIVDS